jgi:hypothetical protein
VEGDGDTDICARDASGIVCGTSSGTNHFTSSRPWSTHFSNAQGWTTPDKYESIRLVDVTGDGLPDVCGRDQSGVWCAPNAGGRFGQATLWTSEFGASFGTSPSLWKTLRYGDVNGDGRSDVCGQTLRGYVCGLATGGSFQFSNQLTILLNGFDWINEANYSTFHVFDANGDGRADVCGRHKTGWMCAYATEEPGRRGIYCSTLR